MVAVKLARGRVERSVNAFAAQGQDQVGLMGHSLCFASRDSKNNKLGIGFQCCVHASQSIIGLRLFLQRKEDNNVQMDVFVMLFNVNMYFEFLVWRFSNPQLLLKCR